MCSLIAAIGKNNELGKNGQLVFHIKDDMQFFRDTTKGHIVVMGRKTWDSLPKKLPDRKNIVVSRHNFTGPDEIIVDGENGFLVDAHDDARMESCILRLMNDPALRQQMSETSYRMVGHFGLRDILNQWCELL